MTETSPLAATSRLPGGVELSDDEAYALRADAGPRPAADRLPHRRRERRRAPGPRPVDRPRLLRGPGAAPRSSPRTAGCAPATSPSSSAARYIKLVDRTKDLVKSGGEWISSVDLENAVMAHPDVDRGGRDRGPRRALGRAPVRLRRPPRRLRARRRRASAEHLAGRVAKWWIPERIEFIDEVPKTSVGKFDKKVLRAPDSPVPRRPPSPEPT